MSVGTGPSVVQDSLLFAFDAANLRCISGVGNAGFLNAKKLITDIVNPSSGFSPPTADQGTLGAATEVKVGNTDYFTSVAIDFPEGTNGGVYVGRNGLTTGYNVGTGGMVYVASRALNLWVWNHDTDSWIPDSWFHGYRINGHCYDSYSGAAAEGTPGGYTAELQKFVDDYTTIKRAFPNCTYVVMGSHRDSCRSADVRKILYDLGMPSGTLLDNDVVSAPEYILVGKPGFGPGKAYVWVYENNDAASAVAFLAFKNMGTGNNWLEFQGNGHSLPLSDYQTTRNVTFETWAWCNSSVNPYNMIMGKTLPYIGFYNGQRIIFSAATTDGTTSAQNSPLTDVGTISLNTWYHIVCRATYTASTNKTTYDIFINGTLSKSQQYNGWLVNYSGALTLGDGRDTSWYSMSGRIAIAKGYSRALSDAEVKQNFIAHRGRFGV